MKKHTPNRDRIGLIFVGLIAFIMVLSGMSLGLGKINEDTLVENIQDNNKIDISLDAATDVGPSTMTMPTLPPTSTISNEKYTGFGSDIEFEFTFALEDLTHETFGDYDILTMPDCELLEITGAPAIPYKLLSVALPPNAGLGTVQLTSTVLEVVTLNGQYDLLPTQEPRPISEYVPASTYTEEQEVASDFIKDRSIYDSGSLFPGEVLQPLLVDVYKNVKLAHLRVFPVQYWPQGQIVTIYTKINVKLEFSEVSPAHESAASAPADSSTASPSLALDRSVYDNLRSVINNPGDLDRFYTYTNNDANNGLMTVGNGMSIGTRGGSRSQPLGSHLTSEDIQYVVITNSTNYYSNFYPLVEWKTKKGVPATIVDDGWIKSTYTGNDTQDKIRNFIRDAKKTWGAKWILLGGDISVIPYRGGYGKVLDYPADNIPTDLYYADLDGSWNDDLDSIFGEPNDNINLYYDVYVGRAPVESTAEVDNFVEKTLFYEKNSSTNFQLDMLFMAEKLDANTDGGISKNVISSTYVPSRFTITKLYETLSNLSKTSALAQMNAGKGIINHAGHCNWNVMSIGPSSLVRSDVDSLTNKYEQGILYTIGCITTAFERNDCIAEHFVKNTNGGTVAFVGNSRYGWYSPGFPTGGTSNRFDQEFFNQLLQKDVYHIGETLAESKVKYVPSSQSANVYRWIQYALNLLGDPELPIWTDQPKALDVTHPMNTYVGVQTLVITVKDGATPLQDALVCIQSDGIYQYGTTNVTGTISFMINPTSSEQINVTATKYNYYPYEGKISQVINDTNPPIMDINQSEYGWYSSDPGEVIKVFFDSDGETDLSRAEYALSPAGPWFTIFNTPHVKFNSPWSISQVWSSMVEGYNKVAIRCFDSANPNHWVMGNITIKKDTVSPYITINSVNYGWYTSDPGVVIDIDFSNVTPTLVDPMNSPLAWAKYSINSVFGPWYNVFTGQVGEYTTNWSVQWSLLDDGENTIYIKLLDEAGNEDGTLDTIIFKRDTLPPKVIVRNGVYGWYSTDPGAAIDIDFSNGGNGSMLDHAEYKIGATGDWNSIFTENTTDYTSNWQVTWSELIEGENEIFVRSYDQVGFEDQTDDSVLIFIDTKAPRIMINQNAYGWYNADPGNVIDIDFLNPDPGGSPLDYARYKVHPEPTEGASGPWRMIFTTDVTTYTDEWLVIWGDLYQGNNTIEIQLYDSATNKNTTVDTVYVLKDIEPPAIMLNTEQYGWFNSNPGSVIDVDFSNNGAGSDLTYAEYRINGGQWVKIADINDAEFSTNWSVDWSKLSEGENDVEARVWDQVGFSKSDNIKIYKDTTVPEIIVNKASYGWYNSDPGAVVNVDFSKGEAGSSNLDFAEYRIGTDGDWIRIFDQDVTSYTISWIVNWSLLDEGENIVYIRGCDVSGNLNEPMTTTIIVKKDTQPPSLTVNTPVYGWYGSDMGEIIDVDFSYLPDSDGQGGHGSSTSSISNSNITKAQYKVSKTGEWLDIFEGNNQTYSDGWGISWELLDQGENEIYFRVFDVAGNQYYDESKTIIVKKDIEPPNVIVNQKEYGWYNSDPGNIIDVDFDANESVNNSPLKLGQYRIGAYGNWLEIFDTLNNPVFYYSTDWDINWVLPVEGQNTVYIRVFDEAGNTNSNLEYVIFLRDTVGPEPPQMVAPFNNARTTENMPVHSWLEPFDPGSNMVTSYHVQVDVTDLFVDSIVDTISTKTSFTHTSDLGIGEYYWRVRGLDPSGNTGEWSAAWQFSIVSPSSPDANLPPVANAGDDVVAIVDEIIWFDGRGSADPENDPLTFVWYMNDDPNPDAQGMYINWKYPINGTYTVILEVFDDHGGYDNDTLQVTVLDIERDTDDDGMSDDWELYYGLDPNNPKDAMEDLDNDGYLNSMEFAQGSAPMNTFSTPITANDRTSPKISHIKVTAAQQLQAVKITATVIDEDSGVKEVNLYYKKQTDSSYNSLSMGNTNPYSTDIPASLVTLDDLEYYIDAVDNAKNSNVAYFGKIGQSQSRPSETTDIDINVMDSTQVDDDTSALDDFTDEFQFQSFEICLTVFVMLIILLISFGVAMSSVVRAKRIAEIQKKRNTITVMRGKNTIWEGIELENISEDEDMNLIDDDFELDEV